VTVVFADVTGSTGLGERLDPETLRRVMTRYFEEMSSILRRHGGTVEKFIGDAVMAVFGTPVLHEDDAMRAVRAAAEMRSAMHSLNEELDQAYGVSLQVRTGVNSGEVVAGDLVAGQTFVTGDAVNVAARLEQVARPGEVLIGEATERLVRDAVLTEPAEALSLRGRDEPVRTYRLIEITGRDVRAARGLRSPMVGRSGELGLLREAFEVTAGDRVCHLFTVMGSAGVGKSRLVDEALGGILDPPTVLRGRCLPYGEGITFWAVGEIVRQACGITGDSEPAAVRAAIAASLRGEENAERIAGGVAQLIGVAGATGTPEETSWGLRRFLEASARLRPLVVVFDDIHWAEPTFLDLVEYLADFTAGPILLVCMARHDLMDIRPSWGAGRPRSMTIPLSPLSEAESGKLIDNLLGRARLDEKARMQITDASEGNPFFIEETIQMLIDDGLLAREDGRWVAARDLAGVDVPPTISALMAARFERLDREERGVVQRAAVVGKVFEWGAVAALSPEAERADVGRHLQALVRKELIAPQASTFTGEDEFRFRHLLIRDAAYQAIPKETRAELHERFAAWVEAKVGDRVTEFEEIVGHHLEQAYRYRAELATVDQRARDLAVRAAERLASSGRRALARGDLPGAVSLLPRAVALLPEGHPTRVAVLPDLGLALLDKGELSGAGEVLAEAVRTAQTAGDPRAEAHASLLRLWLLLHTEPEGQTEAIRREVDAILPVVEELGDEQGVARALHLRLEIDWMACRYGAAEETLQRVVEHARRAGDRRQEAEALYRMTAAVLLGPRPAEEGIRRCREIHEQAEGDRWVEAGVLTTEAELRGMLGRFDGTREQIARARVLLEDLGLTLLTLAPLQAMGELEILAGDWMAAEKRFREAFDGLERMGERGFASTLAAHVARALYQQGRFDEAERFSAISEESAASDDVASQVHIRAIRAKLLAQEGRFREAEALAVEAVELADATDDLQMRGDIRTDLAEVHKLAERASSAVEALEEAARLYDEKGNLVSARRARAELEVVAGV
jgi:class 3 adenylate cyclase/tetratricopeptide (TPR) repeat protein